MSLPQEYRATVQAGQQGLRLDKWLSLQWPELSRSRLQQLIRDEAVQRESGGSLSGNHRVAAEESYRLLLPESAPTGLQPLDLPLSILFEDDHLLVINKPAGLTVHPAPGHAQDTLVNALLAHCGESLSGIGGVQRPGIVHRLDKDTSGAMVVAKNDAAHRGLAAQLKDRSLSRIYHAVVFGTPRPPEGMIDAPLGRSPLNRKKMAVIQGGREARTRYRLLASAGDGALSLMECKLETGRTHQIRVHLAHKGHPLVGDSLYGRSRALRDGELGEWVRQWKRQALHAAEIGFTHPASGESLRFAASAPADFLPFPS